MATQRSHSKHEAQLAFEALSIEGGLLAPEWLAKASQLNAGSQTEVDYAIPRGLVLRDEIGRYWRIAQAHWSDFVGGRASKADRKELSERFVLALLRECFGFTTLTAIEPAVIAERTYPVAYAALGGRVPVVIAPFVLAPGNGLETASTAFGEGGRKRTAFGLAQEFLNAADGAMWGIASDGLTLRIVRDNASLTRPAWIEADLGRIFTEERYADFAALWLLAHQSRFGRADEPADHCALEVWRTAGREQGTRAREHLRRGVEDALVALGQGFVAQPDNGALRAALQDGTLSANAYFQQLLRLVYRLIFLLTVEERELLHPADATKPAMKLYAEGYGLRRLRERSVKRSAHDRYADLWEATKIVVRGVAGGEPRLGLPALAGIFAGAQCPALDAARLENRALLTAVFKLSWLREQTGLSRVNWRDMGPEELGSVYESLLELIPVVSVATRSFSFAVSDETKGNARKTTGSYYTPDSLVQVLLDSALEPVIKETIAANPRREVAALLELSIVDPACGSGHFLLAAARRLAAHVARLQSNGTPSAGEYRRALRQVVGRCIYGVDLNPMAIELCKVALWMEAVEPGLPLGFLDAHIQRGNALLGTTPELMEKGIPDAAWQPIEGDDRKVASALKKRNGKEASGQTTMTSVWSKKGGDETAELTRAYAELDAASDEDPAALAAKESRWAALQGLGAFRHQWFVADAWCAAFVWPKPAGGGPVVEAAPTMGLWRDIRDGKGVPPDLTVRTVDELAEQYHFFHWHLAFPTVFERGGFDVVLGNPPWERVKLVELEYFATRNEAIAGAANASARKALIAALPHSDPPLWESWCAASRQAEAQSHVARQSQRYPLSARGDINTYALFAEHNLSIIRPSGRTGFVSPTGIATDDTTKEYFQYVIDRRLLVALFDFQSGPGLFGAIGHGTFKFCLLTLASRALAELPWFSFYSRAVEEARLPERKFRLSADDIYRLNPNTRTCPTFRSRRDADINLQLYRRAGIFWREMGEDGNPWGISFASMFHMTNDSGLFMSGADLRPDGWTAESNRYVRGNAKMYPLIEAKMLHHFDHRFGDYRDQPKDSENTSLPEVPVIKLQDPTYAPHGRYWVEERLVTERLDKVWHRPWLFGWRDVSKPQNERTLICAIMPRVALGNTVSLFFPKHPARLVATLYASLCSLPLDYAARQKVGGTHLNFLQMKQLPVLPPIAYASPAPWQRASSLVDFLCLRVLELTYTAWDLEPFAQDVGHDGPPFRWDPARRFLLRAELDGAYFHLYGLSRDDADYILDTFPIVKKNDVKAHGEYRTKRVILEIYDAMAEAIRTGVPYVTRLDPPPADPRVAHPPRAVS
jgi:hypothetical protein